MNKFNLAAYILWKLGYDFEKLCKTLQITPEEGTKAIKEYVEYEYYYLSIYRQGRDLAEKKIDDLQQLTDALDIPLDEIINYKRYWHNQFDTVALFTKETMGFDDSIPKDYFEWLHDQKVKRDGFVPYTDKVVTNPNKI